MEKIIVLNRTRAIKYSYQPQEKTFGIISISELADSVPNFHSSPQLKGLLKLQFDDVDQNKDGYYAMTEQDAQKIATFVKRCSSHFDILVVDNASTDGTKDFIVPHLKVNDVYVNTGANLGGSGGFYYGMKYAYEKGYDWLWIMDDDVLPTPTALGELVGHIK